MRSFVRFPHLKAQCFKNKKHYVNLANIIVNPIAAPYSPVHFACTLVWMYSIWEYMVYQR